MITVEKDSDGTLRVQDEENYLDQFLNEKQASTSYLKSEREAPIHLPISQSQLSSLTKDPYESQNEAASQWRKV